MNAPTLALSLLIGAAAVLQGALNRKVAAAWGLSAAIALNTLVLLPCTLALLGLARAGVLSSELFRPRAEAFAHPRVWYVLPGLLGMLIITALPLAIARVGAMQVFVTVVAGQMVASLVWDRVAEGIAPSPLRIAGLALVTVGAYLASIRA
jgi:transporter family-2 protein